MKPDPISGASAELAVVLRETPEDWVAANNAAATNMYTCDLPAGVAALEAALRKAPLANLREPLLSNLCSMYEYASGSDVEAAEAKAGLGAWVAGFCPDDFDLARIRVKDSPPGVA